MWKKTIERKYTYRKFSQEAGLSSPSALKEVVDGKKNLTLQSIPRFAAPFGLARNQLKFFEKLVLFNQAKNEAEKNLHFSEMVKMQKMPKSKTITAKQYAFYSNWFNSAIRELIAVKGFRNEPEWIAEHLIPDITPAQARKAVQLLLDLGLVREEGGKLVQDAPVLEVDPDVSTLSIRNFNRSMIGLGADAVERFSQNDREVSGLTLSVSMARYREIKERIREFKKELLEFASAEEEEPETVCQLNLQLFPLLKDLDNRKAGQV